MSNGNGEFRTRIRIRPFDLRHSSFHVRHPSESRSEWRIGNVEWEWRISDPDPDPPIRPSTFLISCSPSFRIPERMANRKCRMGMANFGPGSGSAHSTFDIPHFMFAILQNPGANGEQEMSNGNGEFRTRIRIRPFDLRHSSFHVRHPSESRSE